MKMASMKINGIFSLFRSSGLLLLFLLLIGIHVKWMGVTGQSIVPGGFQHQLYGNQYPSSLNRNSRVIPPSATSVQNTQFGFFPSGSSNINFRSPQGPPPNRRQQVQQSFGGLQYPVSQQQSPIKAPPRQPPRGEVQYEYYDEPEEDIIYQYGTDINDSQQGNAQKTVVGKGISVLEDQRQSHRPLNILTGKPNFSNNGHPPQSGIASQVGGKSPPRTRTSPSGPGFTRDKSTFIPLSPDEPDPFLALNGRSVHPSNPRLNNLPIRLPTGLLRSSTAPSSTTPQPTAPSTPSAPSRIQNEKPQRSRGSIIRNINNTATTPRSVFRATSRRPNNILRGSSRFTLTSRSPDHGANANSNDNVIPSSSTNRPESVQEKLRKTDKYVANGAATGPSGGSASDGSAASEDYTIEYVEYPASPEDENNVDKSAFEYYEVSEETAKAIIANRTKTAHSNKSNSKSKTIEQTGSNTKVTSSMSVSKSSSTTVSTSSTTTPAPFSKSSEEDDDNKSEKKAGKVVISVSTTKSISGTKLNKETVTRGTPTIAAIVKPTPTSVSRIIGSVQTSQSVVANKATESNSPSKSTTDGTKDSVPSGAETSPEYYEEEYSYPDNFPVLSGHDEQDPPSHTAKSVSSSSSSRESKSKRRRPEDETSEEEESQHAQPQARKLPSKKGEVPLGHFETLVDFGDLESDQRIPIVHEQNLEDLPPPSSSTTTTTTTEAPPLVPIKFAEISPQLLPPGFKFPPTAESEDTIVSSTTTTTTTTVAPPPSSSAPIDFDDIPSFLLPKGYKPLATQEPIVIIPSSTTSTTFKPPAVSSQNIAKSFFPKGPLPTSAPSFNPSLLETDPPKNPLDSILSKIKFTEVAIPGLVPKDFKPPAESSGGIKFETPANLLPPGFKLSGSDTPPPIKFEIPTNLLPAGYKPSEVSTEAPAIKFAIPSNLLPAGYKPPGGEKEEPHTTKKPGGLVFPTRPPSGGGVVFPTKPGGFRVTRPTSTEGPKGDTPPPPRVAIAGGWPVRKTTEFTGWPTTSTTPMPSTSTASTSSTSTTEVSTTTTTKATTTTPPPKRSPLGVCPNEVCRLEATIRIIGGVKWKPEFFDLNTEEYKHFEQTVRRELDGAYRASGLAPWYKRVQIESFNPGSVLVDYFVELEKVDRELTTADVVKVFHKSLLDSDPGDELPLETDAPAALRFGRFNIDPRYTDFKVVNTKTGKTTNEPEPLIPQWAIAVIVIGLVSLLFVIILGVIVLVSRYRNSKKKNTVSLTQEMLNEFNKSHMAVGGGGGGGVDNFGADDLYNMDDVWNDKQMDRTFDRRPTKRSQGSTKGSANYNIYDSWKTEWNGYYGNGNYYGDSGYAPSRRRSDYDTNF